LRRDRIGEGRSAAGAVAHDRCHGRERAVDDGKGLHGMLFEDARQAGGLLGRAHDGAVVPEPQTIANQAEDQAGETEAEDEQRQLQTAQRSDRLPAITRCRMQGHCPVLCPLPRIA